MSDIPDYDEVFISENAWKKIKPTIPVSSHPLLSGVPVHTSKFLLDNTTVLVKDKKIVAIVTFTGN